MALTIDDDAMKQVLAAALLQAISKEDKDKMMVEALASLMTDKDNRGYGSKTRLQSALDGAVQVFAQEYMREVIKMDETIKEKLRAITLSAILATLDGLQEKVAIAVGSVIQKAMEKY